MRSRPQVNFERPPVEEVACGVVFAPLLDLTSSLVGVLWIDSLSQELPLTQDVAPLPRPSLDLTTPPSVAASPFRQWFMSEDEQHVVQIQTDRFHYSWRRTSAQDAYPRYDAVYAAFHRYYETLREYIAPVARVQPQILELTYVNVIEAPDGTAGSLTDVLRDAGWAAGAVRAVQAPRAFQWIADHPGHHPDARMFVIATTVRRDRTGVERDHLRLEITVRGNVHEHVSMDEWFDGAHEQIVHSFVDLTAERWQQEHWGIRP